MLNKLCSPAVFYFFISIFSFLIMYLQNIGRDSKEFCLGVYECNVNNRNYIYLFDLVYIFFWTYLLNLLCKKGYKDISWFLVLLPYLFMFVLIGLIIVNNMK